MGTEHRTYETQGEKAGRLKIESSLLALPGAKILEVKFTGEPLFEGFFIDYIITLIANMSRNPWEYSEGRIELYGKLDDARVIGKAIDLCGNSARIEIETKNSIKERKEGEPIRFSITVRVMKGNTECNAGMRVEWEYLPR